MFKIGDRVKFKKSSIDTGMIDATEEDVFAVVHVFHFASSSCVKTEIRITGYPGGWNADHFEHVKEEIMNNTEEDQEIKWEVGQEVFCCVFGKGKIIEIYESGSYPLRVSFEHEENTDSGYTMDGKLYTDAKNRTLFFSEPKIEAEKFPPKKPFDPKLKFDDRLMVINSHGKVECYGYVEQEFEDSVAMCTGEVYEKAYYNFFKLGEEIKFS